MTNSPSKWGSLFRKPLPVDDVGDDTGGSAPSEVTILGDITTRSAEPAAYATTSIANNASLSGSIDLNAERLHSINLPSQWTAAAITFQSSPNGTTWYDLFTINGEYILPSNIVGINRSIILEPMIFYGIRYLKIRSGTSTASVNQLALRNISLVTVPR